jgi:transposase-like protein
VSNAGKVYRRYTNEVRCDAVLMIESAGPTTAEVSRRRWVNANLRRKLPIHFEIEDHARSGGACDCYDFIASVTSPNPFARLQVLILNERLSVVRPRCMIRCAADVLKLAFKVQFNHPQSVLPIHGDCITMMIKSRPAAVFCFEHLRVWACRSIE